MTRQPRIAVIGGGTMGLYAASRLSGHAKVQVFEANLGPLDGPDQLLGRDRKLGTHDGSRTAWKSTLGGTSTAWGGQLLPWEAWEFQGVGGPSWPLEYSDIAPHYSNVLRTLGARPGHFQTHQLVSNSVAGAPSLRFSERRSTWLGPRSRNFARNTALRPGLRRAEIRLNSIVTRLEVRRGAYLVTSSTRNGERIAVDAFDLVVLAAGTLGNLRLLTEFYDGAPPAHLGAGFMDHVSARVARFRVTNWPRFRTVAGQHSLKHVRSSVKYVARPDFIRHAQILPAYGHWEFDISESSISNALRSRSLLTGRGAVREGQQLVEALGWSVRHSSRPLPRFAIPHLRVDVEQRPSAGRLRWHTSPDEPGHLELDWSLSGEEAESAKKVSEALIEELTHSNLGAELDDIEPVAEFIDTKHMMGGTVMGDSPSRSITTPLGNVHGHQGMWVAGASVFPSGGVANPTFTALALTDRLVDVITA